MPRRDGSSAPIAPRQSTDLDEHREFLIKITEILSGHRPLHEDDAGTIYVLRIPSFEAITHIEEAQETSFGRLTVDYDAGQVAVQETGQVVEPIEEPKRILSFVADMRQLVMTRRRKLAMAANREHTSQYVNPGGQKGHLLKEYDVLLDQIESLHYEQRDRLSDT